MGGYDIRTQNVKAREGSFTSISHGVTVRDRGFSEIGRVTSYRSAPKGATLLPIQVDPYAGFIQRANERKLDGREAHPDFDVVGSVGILDTGHPFILDKWEAGSRSQARSWNWKGNPAYPCRTDGFSVSAATPLDPSRMLFKFRAGSDPFSGSTSDAFGPAILPPPAALGPALADFGRQAMARVAPGRPPIDAFRAAGELFSALPRLPGAALSTFVGSSLYTGRNRPPGFKNIGIGIEKADTTRRINSAIRDVRGTTRSGSSEFLNYIFGLNPTITDLIQIGFGLATLSSSLLQLQRDHGRGVRRSYSSPVASRSVSFANSELGGNILTAGKTGTLNASGGNFEPFQGVTDPRTTTLSMLRQERTWFKGSFTYFLPSPKGFEGRVDGYLAELDKVVNLDPTARNLWELLPWSWLVDWFIDVKSMLDIADVAHDDSLVMNYGYAMRTQTCTALLQTQVTSGPLKGLVVSSTSRFTRKERIRANPYGFTLGNSSDWNPMRWAILAALGLSRH